MHWTERTLSAIVLALMVVGSAAAAETAAPRNVTGEVSLENVPAATTLVLPMTGSFEQHTAAINRFYGYVMSHGLAPGAAYGVYPDDPTEVAEDSLRWEICMSVPPGTSAEAPFVVRQDPAYEAAALDCVGPYEGTATCHQVLCAWVASQGYRIAGPPRDQWLSNPAQVPPQACRSRIYLPVEKP